MGIAKPADVTKLRELGFDPASPPAEALATLQRLHAVGEASVSAIAQALSLVPTTEAAAMLTELRRARAAAIAGKSAARCSSCASAESRRRTQL